MSSGGCSGNLGGQQHPPLPAERPLFTSQAQVDAWIESRVKKVRQRDLVLARMKARAPIYEAELVDRPPTEWRVVRGVRRAT